MTAFILALLFSASLHAKELALTFDDAPTGSSTYFDSQARTKELISKLKKLNVPPVMILANACKKDETQVVSQLQLYKQAGHLIGNHTCDHLRLDDVGFDEFTKNIAKCDRILAPLMTGQKFFRYPYLNESKDPLLRDRVRTWLKEQNYRNAFVSIDNDDWFFSSKLTDGARFGHKPDLAKIKSLFVEHLVGAAEYYDKLSVKTLGRSPKHVMLLHEVDVTVMFIDSLVPELRRKGWKIISAQDAFTDPMYKELPKNTYANNGFIAQLALEKRGERVKYEHTEKAKIEVDRAVGFTEKPSTP